MFRYIHSLTGLAIAFIFLTGIWIYKFNEIYCKKTKYYSTKRMWLSGIILLIVFLSISIEILAGFSLNILLPQYVEKYLLILVAGLGLLFLSLGIFPAPIENRFKVEIDYPFTTRRGGFDLLDTPIAMVDGQLLLYKYYIDIGDIEIIKNTHEVIIIKGSTTTKKYGKLPITANFYSKISRQRITEYLQLDRQ